MMSHALRKSHFLIVLAAMCLAMFVAFSGCDDERKHPTLPGAHPDSWMDPEAADFHGQFVEARGTAFCQECHGTDLTGGKAKIGCIDCHLASGACISCHGGAVDSSGAPPYGLNGETATSTIAVGAHQAHLSAAGIGAAVACNSCHVVPVQMGAAGHMDGDSIAEVIWHGFADGGGAEWNRDSLKCFNTYCHGQFTGGDTANAPIWTASGQAECGSCHDVGDSAAALQWKHAFHVDQAGLPCAACHASVVDTTLTIINPALHINGVVDTMRLDTTLCQACHGQGGTSCISCHGGVDNLTGAPPKGLHGELSRTERAVGAHTTHLTDGQFADAFSCSTCHELPGSIDAPNHLGADSVAEITWSALAGTQGVWNRQNNTCSGTYCHGNFTGGYPANAPVWTDSVGVMCGECHAVFHSPGDLGWKHEYHVMTAGLACADCHASVVDTNYQITDITLHVNGQIDTLIADTTVCNVCHGSGWGTCTSCHGGIDNNTGAPPHGLEGETATTDLAVGAHTAHVEGGAIGAAVACDNCHIVPTTVDDSVHQYTGDDGIAEITWGGIAGSSSVWDRNQATCTNTYCHGNFAGGDNANAPVWTTSNQAQCGSCHDVGSDPSSLNWPEHARHVQSYGFGCFECHATVVDSSLEIIRPLLHVNGNVDTSIFDNSLCDKCHAPAPDGCIGCHGGGDNNTGAPPLGLQGERFSIELAVGAHTPHMEGKTLSDGIPCSECHIVPSSLSDPGHLGADSIAEITWGSLAGVAGIWNRTNRTCADTYCHGDFRGGNASNTPEWTATDQALCGSCHDVGTEPVLLRDRHETHVADGVGCYQCHAATVNSSKQIVGKDVHVNGVFDVVFASGQGNFSNGQCSNITCHGGTRTW